MAPINDTDLFLIEDTTGASKKIAASKLRDNLSAGTYNNFKLLVNTSSYESRWVHTQDLQTNLPDDHWMMVERGGVSYKVSGTDVHNYFPSGIVGATGPILNAHPIPVEAGGLGRHALTVESLPAQSFVDNEAIRMVDSNGDTASYVPVTSTITHVEEEIASYSPN